MTITIVPFLNIFIHSNWRSGGTYFWSKFRSNPKAYGFYEPLFEGLEAIKPAAILLDQSAPALGHVLAAPSKLEYLPLLTDRGVKGFPAGYCYGNYLLSPDDEAPELLSYLTTLAAFARQHRRFPVFGLVRSSLRIGWFKAEFDGFHIAVRREPRQRFLSYLKQGAKGDTYFLERDIIIVGRNRDHPALRGLLSLIDLPDFGRGRGAEKSYRLSIPRLSVPLLYIVFSYLQKLGQIEAARYADLIVDLDQLTRDPQAARRTQSIIADKTGYEIDLSDCVLPRYDDVLDHWRDLYDELDKMVDTALGQSLRRGAPANDLAIPLQHD